MTHEQGNTQPPALQPDAVQADDIISRVAWELAYADYPYIAPTHEDRVHYANQSREKYIGMARRLAAANLLRQSAPGDAAGMREKIKRECDGLAEWAVRRGLYQGYTWHFSRAIQRTILALLPTDAAVKALVLTPGEIQSGYSRQKWAEGLIEQLSKDHEGRNSWLLNYGVGEEAQKLQRKRGLQFDPKYQAVTLAQHGVK